MNALEEVVGLVEGKIDRFKTLWTIFKLETRLAGISIVPLILNVCLLMVLSMGMWVSMVSLCGYVIWSVTHHLFLTLTLIMVLQLFLSLFLVKWLSFNVRKMSFEKTRAYLGAADREDATDVQRKRTAHRAYRKARKKVISTAKKDTSTSKAIS